MNSKRRNARLDALERRIPPRGDHLLDGIDLGLLTGDELGELELAVLVIERLRDAQAGLSPEARDERRERIRTTTSPRSDYAPQ